MEPFDRLLEYDSWANREALTSLRNAAAPPATAVRWMAHIIGAEYVWLTRLREEPPVLEVWPDLDLDGCAARLEDLAGEWPAYLASLGPGDLTDGVGYRNSKGEFWTSTVSDVLTHVVLHSSYHRGQIASALRAAQQEPAYTDYIHAVRQGIVG
jgi:uncharacterized damage-inducible protein DinB